MKLHALLPLLLVVVPAGARKPKPLPDQWVTAWSAADTALPIASLPADSFLPGAADATLREIVPTSVATGPTPLVRLVFSNEFGANPLTLGEVHIALADPKPAARPAGEISLFTANALTFSGQSSATIPAGTTLTSDPVALKLPANANLVVSIFLPAQKIATATFSPDAPRTSFFAPGNVVSQRSLAMPPTQFRATKGWWFVKSVEVLVAPPPPSRK